MAVGAVIAGVAVLQPGWTTSDPTFVFALAYAALGLAIAVRFGAVPFHVPAARLSKGRARLGLPLPLDGLTLKDKQQANRGSHGPGLFHEWKRPEAVNR